MYHNGRLFTIISLISLILITCSKPILPPERLYKRLGGEKTLVAVSLQLSRKPEIRKALGPDSGRIFRQRLTEWLCQVSSGPCDFPSRSEFFEEFEMNPTQQEQLLQSLRQVLIETGIPESEREELLQHL